MERELDSQTSSLTVAAVRLGLSTSLDNRFQFLDLLCNFFLFRFLASITMFQCFALSFQICNLCFDLLRLTFFECLNSFGLAQKRSILLISIFIIVSHACLLFHLVELFDLFDSLLLSFFSGSFVLRQNLVLVIKPHFNINYYAKLK